VKKRAGKDKKAGLKYLQVGLELAFSVLFGIFIGNKLDYYFNARPWLTLTGFFLGMAAGFYLFFRRVK